MRKFLIVSVFLLLFLFPAPADAGVGQQGTVRRVNDAGETVKAVVFTVNSGHTATSGNRGGTWILESTTIKLNSVISDSKGGTLPYSQTAVFQRKELSSLSGELAFMTQDLLSHGFTGTADQFTQAVNLGGNDAFDMASVLSVRLANGRTLTVSSMADIDALPDYNDGGFDANTKAQMKSFFGYAGDPRDNTVVDLEASRIGITTASRTRLDSARGPDLPVGKYTVSGIFGFSTASKIVNGNADVYLRSDTRSYQSSNITLSATSLSSSRSWSNVEVHEGENVFAISVNAQANIDRDLDVTLVSPQDYATDSGKKYTEPDYNNNIIWIRIKGVAINSDLIGPAPDPNPVPTTGNLSVTTSDDNGHLRFKITNGFSRVGRVSVKTFKDGVERSSASFIMAANTTYEATDSNVPVSGAPATVAIGGEDVVKLNATNDGYGSGEPLYVGMKETRYDDNVSGISQEATTPLITPPPGGHMQQETAYIMQYDPTTYDVWVPVTIEPVKTEIVHHEQLWKEVKFKPAKKPKIQVRLVQ